MADISDNLADIRNRISAACVRVGRDPREVSLIAVSKTFPVEAIREAAEAGQTVFGESRLQEALPKVEALPSSLHWHFIGRIQRNKVRKILPCFEVIHAIDSLRLASHTDEVAREIGLFPKVFLQVNVAGEESKGGFEPAVLCSEWDALLGLERLEILGLMCIPPAGPDAESARPWFAALRALRDQLQAASGLPLTSLSMGMSGDYEVAIEEGSTHVRVGSSIFGKRSHRIEGELG